MLEIDPARRISASEALNHEYFRSCEEFETNCASACKEMLTSSTLNSLIDAKTPPAEESKKRTNKHDLSEE
jgi:serine/threonine protein kinase